PVVLIGIQRRGVPMARRIAVRMAEKIQREPQIGTLDINLYRDDLTRVASQPVVQKTEVPPGIDDRDVVLVDDVLYTGRTVRAALDALCDFGRMRTIRGSGRSHRERPVYRMLKRKDLLGIQDISREEILEILDTAESFQEVSTRPIKKVPTLRGKTIINLFFEASTRTRTSFEIAGNRLSADVVNISASTSSISKGETSIDTARTLVAMAAACVFIRHP